jgi:hypothetical protein
MTILNTLPPKVVGEAVELAFMARAAALGLIVSKPLGDSASYDVILGSGHGLLRVQVKSVCTGTGPRYTINAGHGSRAKSPYSADDIDLLVAWVSPVNAWYIIPAEALGGRVRLHLYPQRPDRGGLEDFRERWDLLRLPLPGAQE